MASRENQSERDGDDIFDSLDSIESAFSSLADETRMRILLELTRVTSEEGFGSGLTFSELRERVGVADSGRFNYHLDQLQPEFVRKIDDEHVVRYPGLSFISAVLAGTHRDAPGPDQLSAESPFECHKCDNTLEIQYAERPQFTGIWVSCPEHGSTSQYPVPPGALSGRSLEELMTVSYERALANLDLARRGVCQRCWGRISVEYPIDPSGEETTEEFVYVKAGCERCWNQWEPPLRTVLVTLPTVQAAFAERGVGRLAATNQLSNIGPDAICEIELVDTDPARASARIQFDDGTLCLTIDDECSIDSHRWE